MEPAKELPDFDIHVSSEINLLSEEFKYRSFDPETLAKWLNTKVKDNGGWNNKENKLAMAIKSCIVWGLGRGTNVRKTERTLPKGLEKINRAIKLLRIKEKGPATEMKITIGRLCSCFPILTARILMQMGESFNKVETQSRLPYYLMFPAALSLIDKEGDRGTYDEFKQFSRDFDRQINAGRETDSAKRSAFERLVYESKVVPVEMRKKVLERLAKTYADEVKGMKKDREEAKERVQNDAAKESGLKVDASSEKKEEEEQVEVEKEEEKTAPSINKTFAYLIPKTIKEGQESEFVKAVIADKDIKAFFPAETDRKVLEAYREMIKTNVTNARKTRKGDNLFGNESSVVKEFAFHFQGAKFFRPST